MSPRISIIIPTFNSAKTIHAALDSIVSQQLSDYEVLIMDGASLDETAIIVKEYSRRTENIYWHSEKDNGIYDAMNKGIQQSKGEWLFFLGSDDSLYDSNVFSDMRSIMVENPASKFIYGNVHTSVNAVQKYENYTYVNLSNLNICHQCIFYHRSLFDNLKYNTKYKMCADWDFNLKVFKNSNHPLYVDRIISNYHLLGTSTEWHNNKEYLKFFADHRRLILKHKGLGYFIFYFTQRLLQKITNSA